MVSSLRHRQGLRKAYGLAAATRGILRETSSVSGPMTQHMIGEGLRGVWHAKWRPTVVRRGGKQVRLSQDALISAGLHDLDDRNGHRRNEVYCDVPGQKVERR